MRSAVDRTGLQRQKGASNMVSIKTTQRGLQDGWTRNTFILRKEHLEKIKSLAYWERRTIKEIMDEALVAYLRGKRVKPVTVREEDIR
jgi:hypothetical protein